MWDDATVSPSSRGPPGLVLEGAASSPALCCFTGDAQLCLFARGLAEGLGLPLTSSAPNHPGEPRPQCRSGEEPQAPRWGSCPALKDAGRMRLQPAPALGTSGAAGLGWGAAPRPHWQGEVRLAAPFHHPAGMARSGGSSARVRRRGAAAAWAGGTSHSGSFISSRAGGAAAAKARARLAAGRGIPSAQLGPRTTG